MVRDTSIQRIHLPVAVQASVVVRANRRGVPGGEDEAIDNPAGEGYPSLELRSATTMKGRHASDDSADPAARQIDTPGEPSHQVPAWRRGQRYGAGPQWDDSAISQGSGSSQASSGNRADPPSGRPRTRRPPHPSTSASGTAWRSPEIAVDRTRRSRPSSAFSAMRMCSSLVPPPRPAQAISCSSFQN